jgi:hypothetical protein
MCIGSRFDKQDKAPLAALIKAKENGVGRTPIWNKSHRVYEIIGIHSLDVRQEAESTLIESTYFSWTRIVLT